MGAIFAALSSMGVSFCRTRYSASAARSSADELFDLLDTDRKGFVSRQDYLGLVERQPQVFRQLVGHGSVGSSREGQRASPDRHSHRIPPRTGRSRRRMERGRSVIVGDSNWELVVHMMLGMRISLAAVDETVAEQAVPKLDSARARSGRRSGVSSHNADSGTQVDARAAAAAQAAAAASFSRQLDRHLLEVYKFTLPPQPARRGVAPRPVRFKDYAPLVFRRLRSLFGVAEEDYALALGPEQILGHLLVGTLGSLSEHFSEGKSGAFFYFSTDGLYLIKTIHKREASSLRNLLGSYLAQVQAQPDTLLPRYLGFHRITLPGQSDLYFVVMSNVFATERTIHHRYDLKGSSLGRTAGKAKLEAHPDAVRKDLDLRRPFHVGPSRSKAILKQLAADVDFLRSHDLLDYSLLVGVHFPGRDAERESAGPEAVDREGRDPGTPSGDGQPAPGEWSPTPRMLPRPEPHRWIDSADGGINSAPCDGREPEVYFVGIIDILTTWSPTKSVESMAKQALHPLHSSGVSCVPPSKYAARFEREMHKWLE